MAGPFEVDHATLHTAANDVRSTRSEVDGELKKLWNVVDDLAIAWQGSASTGFQQLMNRWSEDTNKLQEALNNIADLLDKSGTTHQVNDEEQQQMLNKFQSALNG
ncbi:MULTISPECIES: WXG100 family type VII secretion target [Catenuloplanes]|uniref:WXG100 family type VII secretion target n=1 Tax=Catenuloplanes TaxID=33874 RepID=UPI00286B15DD|nr:WXG100 family type VII secretion target [Catenuloplanes niger]